MKSLKQSEKWLCVALQLLASPLQWVSRSVQANP
jgi:hypothetical protein